MFNQMTSNSPSNLNHSVGLWILEITKKIGEQADLTEILQGLSVSNFFTSEKSTGLNNGREVNQN